MTGQLRLSRRWAIAGMASLGAVACVPIETSPAGRLQARLRLIEAAAGGTLGVAFRESGTGRELSYRGDALFPHCSSFKFSLAAMLLSRGESGAIDAHEHVRWSEEDLMFVSPLTTSRLDQGATLIELAEATQISSDNAAANILLRELGGPQALTSFWRSLGDETSRLDRMEPALNNVPTGEMRDTTSPAAMARTVEKILFSDVLSEANSTLLAEWMSSTRTGLRRVRAGLPQDWHSGDKTGTSIWPGMGSVYVDIGFARPPGQPALTFAAYYRASETHEAVDPESETVLAQVGAVLAEFASL